MTYVESRKRCFFCLDKLSELESDQFRNCHSLHGLLHYLNFYKNASLRNGNPQSSSVITCKKCSGVYLKFQDWFYIWQKAEIMLSLCLEEIGIQLKSGDILKYCGLDKSQSVDEMMRTQFLRKCTISTFQFR